MIGGGYDGGEGHLAATAFAGSLTAQQTNPTVGLGP